MREDQPRCWIPVSERLPSTKEYGAYPTVEVVRQCFSNSPAMDGMQTIVVAELRFFGGDAGRPYWTYPKHSNWSGFVENDSWVVTHWRPYPSDMPSPITLAQSARSDWHGAAAAEIGHE